MGLGRLCERPGCSDPASVAYGMRAEDLVFWLDTLSADHADGGVLCRRHADSMVVPRNWTLDDLRDPDLRLFRPPTRDAAGARRGRRSARGAAGDAEQLALGVEQESPTADAEPLPVASDVSDEQHQAVAGEEPADAWTPHFDDGDDLDGLLSAKGPLLARAFRGADRPKTR